jgi:hypothetical protein
MRIRRGWSIVMIPASASTLTISGCIISLWDTRQALAFYQPVGGGNTQIFSPPKRNFGWDPGFEDPEYWPPYCPSAYGVERVGWLEAETYEEEFIWSP